MAREIGVSLVLRGVGACSLAAEGSASEERAGEAGSAPRSVHRSRPPQRSGSYAIAVAMRSGGLMMGKKNVAANVLCGERTRDVIDVRPGDGVSSGT